MSLAQLSVFFAVSFVAAAINSVAGGGTFLTFPVFIINGLTSAQANIMSTIALWPGVWASSYGYRGQAGLDKKRLIPFVIIGVLGGAAGSLWFLSTSETTFARLVPWLLLIATLIFTFGKFVVAGLNRLSMSDRHRQVLAISLQVIISIYGGYFGAGIGILTLAMLQILGHSNIHQMNALKTILTAAINSMTVIIFICSGKVLWSLSIVMIAGALCGGYAGARLALKVPPQHVRTLVSILGFSMTAYFFIHSA